MSPSSHSGETAGAFEKLFRSDNPWRDPILLALLVLAGLAFRLYGISERSLWVDEIHTIAHAFGNLVNPDALEKLGQSFDPADPKSPAWYREQLLTSHGLFAFDETVRVLRYNNHPPLFFWLMNITTHLLGTTPLMLRLPALVFGVACIPMIYLLGRQIHSGTLGLFAASIMAFSGYQIYHAQDARPYTMITLIALTSIWLLLRLIKKHPDEEKAPIAKTRILPILPEWLGLTALSVIGIYTHYFYGPFLLFLFAYGTWRRYRNPAFMTLMSLSFLLVVVALIPWIDMLKLQLLWIQQTDHFTGGLWDAVQVPEYIWRFLNDFTMPGNSLFRIGSAMLFLYSMGIYFYLRRHPFAFSPVVKLCLLWLVVIFGFQIGMDWLTDSSTLTTRRYTLLAAPAFYLLLACALVNANSREKLVRPAITFLMLGMMIFNGIQVVMLQEFGGHSFREAARWIEKSARAGDLVLVNPSGPHAAAIAYYLEAPVDMMGLPVNGIRTLEIRDWLDARIDELRPRYNRIWLVYSQSAPSTRLAVETRILETDFYKGRSLELHNLEVVLYERLETELNRQDPPQDAS